MTTAMDTRLTKCPRCKTPRAVTVLGGERGCLFCGYYTRPVEPCACGCVGGCDGHVERAQGGKRRRWYYCGRCGRRA